ncbi:MAG: aryl-alcohol dehydrogenase-like predicted oxidoreductase [Arenicella sp.]|jgi:aryl-alcohol dehydrogenase-like predicted oxidoreductase
MKYKLFGNSGLRVSSLCLGTMTFGEEWGWGSDKETSQKIYDTFVEAGGNFIDTADVYTEGTSERFLSDFISADRDYVVLATKYTLSGETRNPNNSGNHRKNLRQSVEASLKRLKTDYIDLLWVHAWDFTTPFEELMRSLNDLISSGKVLYIGISDAPAWVVARANTLAEFRGYAPFIGNQLEYNLTERTPERELLPMAKELNIGTVAWSPLATGILTGKFLEENQDKDSRNIKKTSYRFNNRNEEIAREVVKMAKEIDVSSAQVALSWVNQKGVIPIIGSRKVDQLKDNINCLDLQLSSEMMERLDKVSQIDLGFPHTFVLRDGAKKMMYGGMVNEIEGIRNDNLGKEKSLLKV